MSLYALYQHPVLTVVLIVVLSIWSLAWKGVALWFAGKHKQKAWFIVLLLLNTAGILPIVYLFWFKKGIRRARKRRRRERQKQKSTTKVESKSAKKPTKTKKRSKKKTSKKK